MECLPHGPSYVDGMQVKVKGHPMRIPGAYINDMDRCQKYGPLFIEKLHIQPKQAPEV